MWWLGARVVGQRLSTLGGVISTCLRLWSTVQCRVINALGGVVHRHDIERLCGSANPARYDRLADENSPMSGG